MRTFSISFTRPYGLAAILSMLLAGLWIAPSRLAAQDASDPGGSKRRVIAPKPAKDVKTPAKPTKPGGTVTDGAAADGHATTKSQNPPGKTAKAGDEAQESGSFVSGLVDFIRTNAVWILSGLGVALAGVLAWAFLGSRGKEGKGESPFAELGLGEKPMVKPITPGTTRFSSTKIQASDVNDRLHGASKSVTTTEVETDREYALVVDEEALKMPPLPEEAAGRTADTSSIQKHLDAQDTSSAYDEYLRQIESNAAASFQGDLEPRLSEQLLRGKHLEKAARVLEHHVATHADGDVKPEMYFNLGYIHFLNRTYQKSRRFLNKFVEVEKNPAYVARAKKILAKLRTVGTSKN